MYTGFIEYVLGALYALCGGFGVCLGSLTHRSLSVRVCSVCHGVVFGFPGAFENHEQEKQYAQLSKHEARENRG